VINVFTPKPDALDDFLALPDRGAARTFAPAQRARAAAALFRADDDSKAVLVSVFDTAADFKRFTESAPIAAHRGRTCCNSSRPG